MISALLKKKNRKIQGRSKAPLLKQKKKQVVGAVANRKGEGFYMFDMPASLQHELSSLKKYLAAGTAISILIIAVIIAFIGAHSTPDFTILSAALLFLCGLVLYDILSRRMWETVVTEHLKIVTNNHDRLVREVAKNRNDTLVLKEGLAETAVAIEAESIGRSPSHTVEARMLETIITQLSNIGELPRSELGTGHDENILELEISPPPDTPAPLSELDRATEPDFSKISDSDILQMIRFALRNDKIEVFIQPVVSLPQRKPRIYEIFARIRADAGAYVPASRYLKLAQKEHLVPAIDNLLLLRCLQILRDKYNKNSKIPFAINISALTLNDTGFMGDLVTFLTEEREMAHRLIFELPQSELASMDNELMPILDGLAQLGCRFSMDRVKDRKINIHHLTARNIRFIKLDARWLLREASLRGGISRINRLKKKLNAAGIDLIVEKIETETDVRELLDFSISLGQA
jgi:cyclic-di-GMP phosphodiesterase TipF (flagellum assembly factor)